VVSLFLFWKLKIYLIENFLGKGHSQAALSLWNNMLEPVGDKRKSWHLGEDKPLKCPTKEYPYIFTSKNSGKSSDEINQTTSVPTISNNSSSTYGVNITVNQTSTVINNNTSPSDIDTTTYNISTSEVNSTSQVRRKHPKNKKSDPDSSFNKMKFLVVTGFLFILMMILIFGIIRHRKQRTYTSKTGQQNIDYTNDFDDDEMEVYSQSTFKPDYSDNNQIPKTHGKRMTLD